MTLLCVFITTFQVNQRSLLVIGTPSCHLIFERSLYLSVRPSLLTSPFSMVGTSMSASGTGFALSSYRTAYEYINIERSPTTDDAARTGLSFTGSCGSA